MSQTSKWAQLDKPPPRKGQKGGKKRPLDHPFELWCQESFYPAGHQMQGQHSGWYWCCNSTPAFNKPAGTPDAWNNNTAIVEATATSCLEEEVK